ncbi:hypothetical protein P5673_024243 [Acropora cervicornis]|uniref:SANT domain-containing protein n=1 Tax=Acropora cervicornis TaxID=6130 RepID=A0AAD9Q4K7_ACRCE|nr:hypothetical protein P5673_024243 [Acropora cervicornis]
MEDLIEDPVKEERERRRRAVEKWTKETNDKFAAGLAAQGKRIRKLADPLPDITVADCVEHYYMAKPFHFDFEKWRAEEEIKERRSLAMSREDQEASSSLPLVQRYGDIGKVHRACESPRVNEEQQEDDKVVKEPNSTEESLVIEIINDEPDVSNDVTEMH